MNKWQNYNFKIVWKEGQQPNWWVDVFLIDLVVRTIVMTKKYNIKLWRIHRRASKDKSGHEFAFICFCEQTVATDIHNFIIENNYLKLATNLKFIEKYFWKEQNQNNDTKMNDTSDKNWPIELQKAWPYFIHGVSEMFLELITQYKDSLSLGALDKLYSQQDFKDYYNKINDSIISVWNRNGNHAFFHHLNAIYGYNPLIVQPRNIAGFIASF